MKRSHRLICPGLYAATAVGTFGHAAAGMDQWQEANCSTQAGRFQSGMKCYGIPSAMTGLVSAALWPLYWSWELQA